MGSVAARVAGRGSAVTRPHASAAAEERLDRFEGRGEVLDLVLRIVHVKLARAEAGIPSRTCSGMAQWCPARIAMP